MSKIGVIILAAGKGTRMQSDIPKVCFKLAGKTLIQRVVDTSLKINADLIAIVVGYKKEMVIDTIEAHQNIHFVTQENQNGTGDAVKSAKELFQRFDGNVFILCGDVPLLKAETLQKMLDKHLEAKAHCTVLTMILNDPDKYGRMVRDDKGNVCEIVEFRDATDEVKQIKEINTGIYVLNCKHLFDAIEEINDQNNQNEYYLTDVLKIFYHKGLKIESIILDDILEAAGVNSQEQLAEMEKHCR